MEVGTGHVCVLDPGYHKVKSGMLVDLVFILLAVGNVEGFNRMMREKGNDFK